MKNINQKDKVYYDNDCYVCSLEINTVRKRGEACGIGGKQTSGAETFRKLYEKMGFKRSVALSRLPVIRNLVDAGYFIFSRWIRPILPKRS